MKSFEIEQKYRIQDPSSIRRILAKLKAKRIKSGEEKNELFDFKRLLSLRKSVLRLRRAGGKAWLTFKGPRMKGKYKKRVEIEMPVDYAAIKKIFEKIGFKAVAHYEKKREEFKLGRVFVTIDYLKGNGWFVEVEGAPAEIATISKKLKLSDEDVESKSYLELLYPKK